MRPGRPWRGALALAPLLATAAGCGTITQRMAPTCVARGADTLLLMAQSVPTASLVPCIAGYPAGWHFTSVDVRNGRSVFVLDSDRAGTSALRVGFSGRCDVSGATEIPTDEPGTRRFERILSVQDGFRAVRSYQFDGGCATYRLNFRNRSQALANEVSVAVSFTSRAALEEATRARLRRGS